MRGMERRMEMRHPLRLVRSVYLAFYGWSHIRSGKQNEGNCQVIDPNPGHLVVVTEFIV